MQGENQNFSEFFSRTEQLAEKLGVRAIDLPEIVGVSKAMLFAYRKGKNPISWKAWRKLEAAERAAGIGVEASGGDDAPTQSARVGERSETSGNMAREMKAMHERLDVIHERLDKIEGVLSALAREIRRR